jgi:hypothetical protein
MGIGTYPQAKEVTMSNDLSPKDKILVALTQLDPNDDSHWNTDGLPNTGTVQRIAHDQTIKRGDIQNARPGFDRDTARAEVTSATGTAPADFEEAPGLSSAAKAEAVATATAGDEVEISDDQLRALLAKKVKDAEAKIEQGRQMARDAVVMQQEGINETNAARREFHKYFPPMTQAQNIKAHLAAENEARAARVAHQGAASHLDAVRRAPVGSINRGYGRGASRGAFSRQDAARLGFLTPEAKAAGVGVKA